MFDDFFEIFFDESDEVSNGLFNEFKVEMYTVGRKHTQTVELTIWAAGFEEALTCGEVLTAVYLA